eukprot:TRINITY_DN5347_c0_g1_i2.p1 TRINITY_DN5347_c0_g1~~TRINITY_DN5347_c0_g1_i2.p1  ORF type:complete len:525 (-),score=111.98 TRINITY_DN5347_c0_g1_i2:301-1650(-)
MDQGDYYLRPLVFQLQRLLSLSSFFVVGFFGWRWHPIDENVLHQIWALDTKLLEHLKKLDRIIAYVSFKKPMESDGEFFNIVILDDALGKDLWMQNGTHHCAMSISNKFYERVRIHNFNMKSPINPSVKAVDVPFEPRCTTYVSFQHKQTWWRGQRWYLPPPSGVVSWGLVSSRRPLRFGSFMGHVAYSFHKQITHMIGERLGVPVELVPINDIVDQRFQRVKFAQTVRDNIEEYGLDFAFICGVEFHKNHSDLNVIVAPVRAEGRYGDRPVYFADVIVRKEPEDQQGTPKTLEDLRGSVFGCNEMTSYSGYHMIANHLQDNFNVSISDFFMETRMTTSHASSIQQVLSGMVTCAVIDSTILEMEASIPERSEEYRKLHVVHSLGPAPMPPLVCRRYVHPDLISSVRDILVTMHDLPEGSGMLAESGFSKFVPVDEKHYESILTENRWR